jgi:hypothetical protein
MVINIIRSSCSSTGSGVQKAIASSLMLGQKNTDSSFRFGWLEMMTMASMMHWIEMETMSAVVLVQLCEAMQGS